jgi:hypothetical protein
MLAEQDFECRPALATNTLINDAPVITLVRERARRARRVAKRHLLTATTCFGLYDHGMAGLRSGSTSAQAERRAPALLAGARETDAARNRGH